MSDNGLIFYHSPNTRSSGVLILLEELDAPYALRDVNFRIGAQREPAYLAVNPLGKVPAIVHDGALVTELGYPTSSRMCWGRCCSRRKPGSASPA